MEKQKVFGEGDEGGDIGEGDEGGDVGEGDEGGDVGEGDEGGDEKSTMDTTMKEEGIEESAGAGYRERTGRRW